MIRSLTRLCPDLRQRRRCVTLVHRCTDWPANRWAAVDQAGRSARRAREHAPHLRHLRDPVRRERRAAARPARSARTSGSTSAGPASSGRRSRRCARDHRTRTQGGGRRADSASAPSRSSRSASGRCCAARRPGRATCSGTASACSTTRRCAPSRRWAASPRSPSRTRTTTRRWSSGAGPSATRRSTSTPTTASGSCAPTRRSSSGRARRIALGHGLTLIRCGGHFAGAQVLHWAGGADGRGALLAGDILQVVQDRRYVSFMYSYPNFIPLPAATVRRIVALLEPYAFERIYGAWLARVVRARRQGSGAPLGRALHPRPRGRSIVELPRSAAAAGFGARSNTV